MPVEPPDTGSVEKRVAMAERLTRIEAGVGRLNEKLDEALAKFESLDSRVENLEVWRAKVEPLIGAAKWVATAIMALILGLLWAILTHQIPFGVK